MSLQLHLPLLGDLRNNGLLGDATVTNYGATVNDSGKIGKCYAFNGSQYITVNNPLSANTPEFSIAAWVYFTDVTGYYASIYCARTATGGAGIVAYIYDSGPDVYLRFDDGATYQATYNLPRNQWVHLVFVRTRTGKAMYVNGVSVMGTTTVGNLANISTTAMIGNDQPSMAHGLKGRLNDIRVYDHRISDREIKELAKGLVAHWKLDDFIGNENLSISTPKYLNHGAYNAYQFSLTENLVAGNKYTIQLWDVDVSHSEKTESQLGISVYWGGGSVSLCTWRGTGYFVNGHADHLIMTFTAPESTNSTTANAWLNIYNSVSYVAGTLYMNIGRWKLEKGEVATSWIPSSADDMYSNWELNKAHDSSGYCHDGTLSPTPPTFDSDSARYSGCMKFSSNYIHCGLSNLYPTDEITVAWWGYMDSWSSYGRAISCTESGGWNFESNSGKIRFVVYKSAYGYGHALSETSLSSLSSGWHFFAGTFDGYVLKIYVDGEYESVSTDASPEIKAAILYRANIPVYIGCEANGANPSSPYFNGKLSDIRIYSTALSADDIKELYNTSASIDNRHNVFAREFIEA